jgi:hypothetical protein
MRETMRKISSYIRIPVHCGVWMKKIVLLAMMLMCAPFLAHAQGGTCPSGANYINPANGGVAGSLVALSTSGLGVTNCFYISAAGLDTNNGTSESTPWLHAPGMPNCANVCASVTPAAGEGFIFRGGDTWHYNKGTPLVGGQWTWTQSGTSSNYIYIGVDPNWFNGNSWARPILTNDNPVTAGGIVPSCTYPMGNFVDVTFSGVLYAQFDNFEFTGMCWDDAPNNSNAHAYLSHSGQGPSYATSYRVISNNYFHGWTHVAFTPATCAGNTGVCNNVEAIRGDTHLEAGTQIIFNVIDNSDGDPLAVSGIDSDGYIVAYNVMRYFGGTQILDNCHSIHDNLFEHINNDQSNSTHSDMWFCNGEAPSDNYFYNNLIRYIGTDYNQDLSAMLWFNPIGGYTDYVFNNVSHDLNCTANCMNFHTPSSAATMYIYNNTMQSKVNNIIWANTVTPNLTIHDLNNHYITNNGTTCAAVYSYTAFVNGGGACSGDVFQTISAANKQGYTSANDFTPTAASTATLKKGLNLTSLISTFGSAFGSSTTNGCTYVVSNHTVSCPGVTANIRPLIALWDAGAYMSGASATLPAAPRNLAATVN